MDQNKTKTSSKKHKLTRVWRSSMCNSSSYGALDWFFYPNGQCVLPFWWHLVPHFLSFVVDYVVSSGENVRVS